MGACALETDKGPLNVSTVTGMPIAICCGSGGLCGGGGVEPSPFAYQIWSEELASVTSPVAVGLLATSSRTGSPADDLVGDAGEHYIAGNSRDRPRSDSQVRLDRTAACDFIGLEHHGLVRAHHRGGSGWKTP